MSGCRENPGSVPDFEKRAEKCWPLYQHLWYAPRKTPLLYQVLDKAPIKPALCTALVSLRRGLVVQGAGFIGRQPRGVVQGTVFLGGFF